MPSLKKICNLFFCHVKIGMEKNCFLGLQKGKKYKIICVFRTLQEDYIYAESNLRQALSTREQWFGKAHPLVADTLFALAELMGKTDNCKGYVLLKKLIAALI